MLLLSSACGGGSGHTLNGTLTISSSRAQGTTSCQGASGYSDIRAETQVTVSDAGGKVLAAGQLKSGSWDGAYSCVFGFSVSGLPDADLYQVEVSHRGKLVYSRQDLDSKDWKVALRIG